MRTLNHLMLAGLSAFVLLVMVAVDDDAPSDEPDVTIRREDGKIIQEYRANNFLYAIKAVPKHSKPYLLVRADSSDGNFVRSDQPDKLIPQQKVFSW